MGTVVFDFDSTLVSGESVETLVQNRIRGDAANLARVAEITRRGMDGQISYGEALRQRLAVGTPTRAEVLAYAEGAVRTLSRGAADLIERLGAAGHQVWVATGAFVEIVEPTTRRLKIPDARVLAVRPRWNADGTFELRPDDALSWSKAEGCRPFAAHWPVPRIAVGDAMTDYGLLVAGAVDHFLGYVEHVRRASVVATGAPLAASMAEVAARLSDWLGAF